MSGIKDVMSELKAIESEGKRSNIVIIKSAPKDGENYVGGANDGRRFKKNFYETMEQAGVAALALGIEDSKSYKALYKKDKRLPSDPAKVYGFHWAKNGKWLGFLTIAA